MNVGKIVNFIGAPCSGKSTTSALIYYKLKQSNYPCEFVPEFARKYIATSRRKVLNDADQANIMLGQVYEEGVYEGCHDTITVSDSSPLNSLLYFDDIRKAMGDRLQQSLESIDDRDVLYFYLKPLDLARYNLGNQRPDVNRLHSYEQSLDIDKTAIDKIKAWVPNFAYIRLDMNLSERAEFAFKVIVNYFNDSCR